MHLARILVGIGARGGGGNGDQDPLGRKFQTPGLPAAQDFEPRIHVTDSDFASITENGRLCDENGQMGQARIVTNCC